MIEQKQRAILFVILSISFFLKFALWLFILTADVNRFDWPDTKYYQLSALALLQTGSFSISPENPDEPQTFRIPGYPIFLVAVYAIFGSSKPAVIFIQIMLSLGTISLIYFTADKLYGSNVALITTLLLALDHLSLSYSMLMIPETLFTLLIAFVLFTAVNYFTSDNKAKWALILGVCFSLAALVKPIGYYLIFISVLGIMFWNIAQKVRWKDILISILFIIVTFIFVVGGWQLHNYKHTGIAMFSSLVGRDLLFWHGAAVISLRDGIELGEVQTRIGKDGLGEGFLEQHPEAKDLSFAERTEIMKRDGLNLIMKHPFLFIRNYTAGLAKMMIRPGIGQLLAELGVPLELYSPRNFYKYPLIR